MIQNLINNNDSKQFQEYKQKKSEKPGTFNLSYQNIETITTFQTPEKIFCLNFSNNLIKNLENLDNLKNLKELDLSHNNLTNLEGLDSCKSLTLLNLSNNFIDSLEFIPKLSMLGDLNLNKNNLKNLKGLENLKDLKKISISSNKLQNIGLLPNFNKYEELILYDNHLETINPNAFEYANSLVYLDLSKNYLQNLNFLTPLKNIQVKKLKKYFVYFPFLKDINTLKKFY